MIDDTLLRAAGALAEQPAPCRTSGLYRVGQATTGQRLDGPYVAGVGGTSSVYLGGGSSPA